MELISSNPFLNLKIEKKLSPFDPYHLFFLAELHFLLAKTTIYYHVEYLSEIQIQRVFLKQKFPVQDLDLSIALGKNNEKN